MIRRKHTRKHLRKHSRKPSRKHSRRCIFRYKHTRKQHRKQQRKQRGGVSEDMPTTLTIAGTPLRSNNDIEESSVVIAGFPPMTPKDYKKMAEDEEQLKVEY